MFCQYWQILCVCGDCRCPSGWQTLTVGVAGEIQATFYMVDHPMSSQSDHFGHSQDFGKSCMTGSGKVGLQLYVVCCEDVLADSLKCGWAGVTTAYSLLGPALLLARCRLAWLICQVSTAPPDRAGALTCPLLLLLPGVVCAGRAPRERSVLVHLARHRPR